jgi:2'-5' RNA ligase
MKFSVYETIWQEFKALGRISKAPRKEGVGITLVVSLQDREVIEQILEIQKWIGKTVPFDAIPPGALHITVRNIQSLEDDPKKVSSEKLSAVLNSLRTTLKKRPPFQAVLRNINSFLVSPFVEVHDAGRLTDIRNDINPELDRLGLADADYSPHGYVSHLTLGYYEVIQSSHFLLRVLEKLRPRKFGKIEVRNLKLVRTLWASGLYHMELMEEIRLGEE